MGESTRKPPFMLTPTAKLSLVNVGTNNCSHTCLHHDCLAVDIANDFHIITCIYREGNNRKTKACTA